MPVHPSRDYAITVMYAVQDDAWHLELELLADQRTLVIAIVPDEHPTREPTVRFEDVPPGLEIPYEVVHWFMTHVAEEIRTTRGWMRLRPELVGAIYQLRQEHPGGINDEDFLQIVSEARSSVPEQDLPAVLAAGLGRGLDGTVLGHEQAASLIEARVSSQPDVE